MAIVNNFGMAYPEFQLVNGRTFYNSFIQNLKPGLNELIFHLAFDDDEFKAITIDHPDYGAAWRQRDFDYATSEEFKTLLKKDNIRLITWGDIQKVMYKQTINVNLMNLY